MEDHPDMKKSNIWTILVPAFICIAILIGVFIGRISAGDRIQLESQFAAGSDSDNTSGQIGGSSHRRIDINTAEPEILDDLPGIGKVLAQNIVDFRNTYGPFESIEDLLKVSGIGEKKLKEIIPYITVGGQK
ncbi:MAG: helix-hairpin-helix domain-containing protein [Ruminococcaceae bacterium]|nr:helix-hairpin-helix domain-containing protein [Oscillospiraceae bacterium]